MIDVMGQFQKLLSLFRKVGCFGLFSGVYGRLGRVLSEIAQPNIVAQR
jgi:hypothetical protein